MSKKLKYITKVKQPLVKPCPGAQGCICCNYVVVSQILNCPYNCSYCFLHTFFGRDEIVIIEDEAEVVRQVKAYLEASKEPLRVGTGEYSDSLALPDAVSLAKKLVALFAGQDKHLLELKTKSAKIDQFLRLNHKQKTVLAWSVNPERVVKSDELGAPSLARRLAAAQASARAGYPAAFHLDPIIYYPGWEMDYRELVAKIFQAVPAKEIAWISLGGLRFPARQKEQMRQNKQTSIRFEHLKQGSDTKLRYPADLRARIFKRIYNYIREQSQAVFIYLCMESVEVWTKAQINNQPDNPYAGHFKFSKLGSSM